MLILTEITKFTKKEKRDTKTLNFYNIKTLLPLKGSRAPNLVSPVARPGSPFIALDMLISSGFDSSPWARVRFPTWAAVLRIRIRDWVPF
jgi:hypothetical protein